MICRIADIPPGLCWAEGGSPACPYWMDICPGTPRAQAECRHPNKCVATRRTVRLARRRSGGWRRVHDE